MSAISGFCEKCNGFRKRYCYGDRNTCMSILFDTIEALQLENEQLRAKLGDWKYEVQCHMDEVTVRDKENEQLRVQVARMREALIFTKEKIYEQLSNYVNDPKKFKYSAISIECVQKIIRALADASDYHNPTNICECCDRIELAVDNDDDAKPTCKTTGMPCCRCQPVCEHRGDGRGY